MDKLKATFSRGKNDEPEETASAAGKMSGPGSHFQSAKENSGLSSNTTGTGYSPETGGDQSVDTLDRDTVGTSTDQPGTAIGQTSTYSSTPLAKGDPTSSVIDPESKDPMTYQKPERASYGASGVPEGSATVAASKAFGKTSEDMPGSYPSAVEPEPTSHSAGLIGASATTATTEAAGSAASHPTSDRPGAAPSTLTGTTSPGERLTDYGDTEQPRGLDSTNARGGHGSQPGMVGRVLGAVGLGGLAGAGGAKGASGHEDSAVSDTADQPTTTTGISSSNVPQHSGPPPSHHRKESIPTTAYPAGPGSSRAVAPPVGGTRPHESSEMSAPQDNSGHRDAALGAAAVGAGAIGAGAYAAHDRGDRQAAVHETATPANVTGSSAPISTGPTTLPATSGTTEPTTIPAATWLRENPTTTRETDSSTITQPERGDHTTARATESSTMTQPERDHHTTARATEPWTITQPERRDHTTSREAEPLTSAQPEREDHTGRNVATGTAAGVGVGAAGAYAAHDYDQHHAEKEAAKRAAEEEEQRAAQQAAHEKELEKQHKAQEKAAAKEEKHHQKEAEHAEKKHQKELEKEEKHREKEAAAAAKEREAREAMERKRLEREDEDRKRRERELAAGAGVGATGAGVAAYGASRDNEPKSSPVPERTRDTTDGGEVEKKPSILKRLFKRTRKNKDTGEDEEYEEEGDEDHTHRGAAAATATGAGVAGAGAYYGTRDDDKPTTSTTGTTDKSYAAEGGGVIKPSHDPLSKKDQSTAERSTDGGQGGRTGQQVPYETEPTPATTSSSTHRERNTEPSAITSRTGAGTTGVDSTTSGDMPIEPVTGLPYDPSKDPEAAKRIEEGRYNAVGTMEEAKQAKQEHMERGNLDHDHGHGETHESGEHGKKSLGMRLKEKLLPVGGGVKEEDLLKEEGFTRRSEQP